MKIITVVGARPQFIKLASLSRALCTLSYVEEIIIHTGQHYDDDMSRIFFQELELQAPTYNLNIGSQNHGAQTGRMLEAIEKILLKEKPDRVLVYGDTNSTLAGALAATKLHIPIGHIEAGLRSFNVQMPEEINRILTDHISDLLFVPTKGAVDHLHKEGISPEKIKNVGDVMYDTALYYSQKAEEKSRILDRLKLSRGEYILATLHRAENTDSSNKLFSLLKGLSLVASKLPVIVPLHPRTWQTMEKNNFYKESFQNITFIEPLGYLDIIMLEKNAQLIATDSGGMQKEAFFYQVPCVTLRKETEWMELVELGWNTLLSSDDPDNIKATILKNLGQKGREGTPYGAGNASQKIVEILHQNWSL